MLIITQPGPAATTQNDEQMDLAMGASAMLDADTQRGAQRMVLSQGVFTNTALGKPYCLLTQPTPFLMPGKPRS